MFSANPNSGYNTKNLSGAPGDACTAVPFLIPSTMSLVSGSSVDRQAPLKPRINGISCQLDLVSTLSSIGND
jgi:hypothetical protein